MFAVVALLLATTIKTLAHTQTHIHTCVCQSKYPLAVLFCWERPNAKEMTFRLYVLHHRSHTHTRAHSSAKTNKRNVHKIEYAIWYFLMSISLTRQHSINITLTPTIQSDRHTHTHAYMSVHLSLCVCFSAAPPTPKLQHLPPCCRTCR